MPLGSLSTLQSQKPGRQMTALRLHVIVAAIAVDSLFASIPRGELHLLTGLLKEVIYLKG